MVNNQHVNKVEFGNQTLMDISNTTATADDVAQGKVFYTASGAQATGTSAGGGDTTPIGTVIYYAGKTAPEGYLACDGTVYNISAYPELAAFMQTNYGSKNYWGGNGSTTFGVPNWQGEFFRAAGTQSRANQGSGGSVGAHQDGTLHIGNYSLTDTGAIGISWVDSQNQDGNLIYSKNRDNSVLYPYKVVAATNVITADGAANESQLSPYTSRPTNTSLLVCIKAT